MTPMQVRKAGRWIGFMLLTAALVHVATVWLLPQLSMNRVFERTGDSFGYNSLQHLPPVNAESRAIVRPDPDIAYSVCAYDLSQGPLSVRLPQSADDLSLAAYADDTANFLTVGEQETGTDGWTGVIATEDQAVRGLPDAVVSPSTKGIVLVRRLVRRQDDWPAVDAERAGMACGPFALQ
ncbi:MAG: DUF1254 domain-containing protein [Minwuia sp.]|uniref:DUF1254 domain-containing protein n=1 Tax=Minwuia sp. TaxID=2493630 RepID=UPI003A8C38DB